TLPPLAGPQTPFDMIYRFLTALCMALTLAAGSATAQGIGTYYETSSGVRLGIGGGVSIYNGPNTLYPLEGIAQEDVTETNPAVTGFVEFPLGSDQLYGRLMAGVLNIGADDDTAIARRGGNPFLTNEQLLLEGDLMFKLAPSTSSVVPYLFGGIGALIADPFGSDDVADALDRDRVAYVLPVGIGLDLKLTPNLSLFGEGSYRFPLNSVGVSGETAGTYDAACGGDPDCIKKCLEDPSDPICVLSGGAEASDTKFGSALLIGGLRLGFGAPRTRERIVEVEVPVERIVEVPVERIVEVPVEVPVERPYCDIVELSSVYFAHGSSVLSSDARSMLDDNIEILMDNSACCLTLHGYTDSSEYDRFGMGLSGRRAQAVYDYYLSQGVAASRITIENKGAMSPSCDKEDPGVGCSRSRRVDSLPMDCEALRRSMRR
ncbi:MAG: OmpA family protein, partial [Bacteroidota bacterium]